VEQATAKGLRSLSKSEQKIAQSIRRVIADSQIVVVVGWKSSNHGEETRGYSPRRIRFVDITGQVTPPDLPLNTGLVLKTRFVRHGTVTEANVPSGAESLNQPLGIGKLRVILGSCQDVLVNSVNGENNAEGRPPVPEPPKPAEQPATVPENETDPANNPDNSVPPPSSTKTGKAALTDILVLKAFCIAYERIVQVHGAQISSHQTSKLIKRFWPEARASVVATGLRRQLFLVGRSGTGSKVGFYEMGPAMQELLKPVHQEDDPDLAFATDKLSSLSALVRDEPVLRERRQELTSALEEVEAKLARIDRARNVISRVKKELSDINGD